MIVIIFGAAGQLGRALTETKPDHATIHALGRETVDITSTSDIDAAITGTSPDLVINAAAYTAVDRAESQEDTAFAVNGAAPGLIAQACRKNGAALAHLSTDYVFDGAAERPYRPDDPTGPVSVYGKSKLAGERAVFDAMPDALIVRTAWVYGAGSANFVTAMLRRMADQSEIGIVADQFGAPTHTISLARAIWMLTEAGASGVHHYTDAGKTNWHGFASAIEEEARALGMIDGCAVTPIATADYPTPARRPANSVLDCEATYAIAGAARHWREELRIMLRAQKAMERS